MAKSEGKGPFGRPLGRWEDNIKVDLRLMGCNAGHWIDLSEDRDQLRANVRTVMNLRAP